MQIILAIRENISTKEKENKFKIIKKKRTEEIITGIRLKSETIRKSVIRGNVENVVRTVTFAPSVQTRRRREISNSRAMIEE